MDNTLNQSIHTCTNSVKDNVMSNSNITFSLVGIIVVLFAVGNYLFVRFRNSDKWYKD